MSGSINDMKYGSSEFTLSFLSNLSSDSFITDCKFSHCLFMFGILIHFNPDPNCFYTNVSNAGFDITVNTGVVPGTYGTVPTQLMYR